LLLVAGFVDVVCLFCCSKKWLRTGFFYGLLWEWTDCFWSLFRFWIWVW